MRRGVPRRQGQLLGLALVFAPVLAGCAEDDPPAEIDLGQRSACELLELSAPADGQWTVEGPIGFDVPRPFEGRWQYRVPVVAVDTELTLTHSSGKTYRAQIPGAEPVPGLADGMAPGCGPFPYGVASGDPWPDGVYLWTQVEDATGEVPVTWELAASPDFADPLASGEATASPDADHTVQVRVDGLDPASTYYYRFALDPGDTASSSITGRTRTAPGDGAEQLRFAVTSCTSIFSGYFNGYRAIARRLDLDGLIHVGDYLYDFPDEDELVRIPDPVPADPESLEEWRALHRYHLSDPDLRAARAAHPWIMLWDNHDVNPGSPVTDGGSPAFREWNPIAPPPEGAGPEHIYRRLELGDLVDVIMIDVLLFRDPGDTPDGPDKSILGADQEAWLESELQASTARWKIVGNQKPVAPILGLLSLLGGSTWNGYPDARAKLFDFLESSDVNNVLFLSGDAHITVIADLATQPDDLDQYDPATGQGSVAAEFQPASMSRGNVDEFFPDQPNFPSALEEDAKMSEPHYRFVDTTRHGYGILDVTPARIRAEVWYLDILERTDEEALGAAIELRDGDRHWQREVEPGGGGSEDGQ